MNWQPVKSILLLLLLLANLFLLGTTVGGRMEEKRQYEKSAEEVAEFLASQGIDVDREFLSVRESPAGYYTFAAPAGDLLLSAAARFFDKTPDAVFLLPGGLRAETAEGASVSLAFDGRVCFPADAEKMPLPTAFSPLEGEEDAADALALISEKLGTGVSELSPVGYAAADGTTYLKCRQTLDGLPIFDNECVFGISDGKLTVACGKLFLEGGARTFTAAPCLDRVNIMLSELRRGAHGRVLSLTLCYAIYENSEKTGMFAYPAYEIVYASADAPQSVCVCVCALDGERY